MRDYIITINNDGTVTAVNIPKQYIAEENATQLVINLNDELKAPNISFYTLCFSTCAGHANPYKSKYTSDKITAETTLACLDNGTLYYPIPNSLAQYNKLEVQVQAHALNSSNELIYTKKSPVFEVCFERSVTGEEQLIEHDGEGFIKDVYQAISQMNKTTKEADELCSKISNAFDAGEMNGCTFIPSINENGELSWTNDGDFENPPSFLIRGSDGKPGKNATVNGLEAVNIEAGKNISITQSNNSLSVATDFKNQNTLELLYCESAESPIVTEYYPDYLKFNGSPLRRCSDGRVISSIAEATDSNGKKCLRMRFNPETMSLTDFPDYIDIPIAEITPSQTTLGTITLNGSSLDFGANKYKPMPMLYVQPGTVTLSPNTAYSFGEAAELDISLLPGEPEKYCEYIFSFTSGETPTVLTLPADIKWANELSIEAGKAYEISIVNSVALWVCTEVSA